MSESPREARIRRACYLTAMGHSTSDVAKSMNTTAKAVRHMLSSGSGPTLVKEFQSSQENAIVETAALLSSDHVAKLQGMGLRVVDGFERLLQKSERGELAPGTDLKVLGDIADRIGIPRQTAQTVRHQHDRPLVNRESIVEIAALGAAMLSSGALSGMDFRELGKQLRDSSPDVVDVEVFDEEPETVPVGA